MWFQMNISLKVFLRYTVFKLGISKVTYIAIHFFITYNNVILIECHMITRDLILKFDHRILQTPKGHVAM